MSLLGSGRKEKIGSIEALTSSEKEVLIALAKWDYSQSRANSFSISLKLGIAQSTTAKAIQFLSYRGFLGKTSGRSWFIYPQIKEIILKEINPPVCEDSVSASVVDQVSDSSYHKDSQDGENQVSKSQASADTN